MTLCTAEKNTVRRVDWDWSAAHRHLLRLAGTLERQRQVASGMLSEEDVVMKEVHHEFRGSHSVSHEYGPTSLD